MATNVYMTCYRRWRLSRLNALMSGICNRTKYSSSNVERQVSRQKDVDTKKWRIISAACVERLPIITPPLTEMESRVQELFDQIEFERSLISDHEFYLERRETEILEKMKGVEADAKKLRDSVKEEIDKEVQEMKEEAQNFQPASRITEVDDNGDRRSTKRKLSESLYLLVKNSHEQHSWQIPQGVQEGEESLRQAAERGLKEECGEELQVKFLGNAPSAVYSKHERKHDFHQTGAKVFFYKSFYTGGQVILNREKLEDFVWVTSDEMKEYITSEYFQFLSQFMFLSLQEKLKL